MTPHNLDARLRLYASAHGFLYRDGQLHKIVTTPDEADEVIAIWERLQAETVSVAYNYKSDATERH